VVVRPVVLFGRLYVVSYSLVNARLDRWFRYSGTVRSERSLALYYFFVYPCIAALVRVVRTDVHNKHDVSAVGLLVVLIGKSARFELPGKFMKVSYNDSLSD